jgi:hypothetical protein
MGETWLIEHRAPRILRLVRLGHTRKEIDDLYSHVTPSMIHDTLTALQQRWAQDVDGPGNHHRPRGQK